MTDKKLNVLIRTFDNKDLIVKDIPERYFYDESTIYNSPPDAVFLPDSQEKIVEFIKIAKTEGIKIIPRGAGTGVAGGAVALYGGVILSLERMNRIIDIDETNMCVTIEPGVINGYLKDRLKEMSFYYPPDPQSYETSSIGGNIATNAGGPRAIRYGTTKDYVMSLKVITGEGDVIVTGGKVYKNSSGYNLNELFCGSEGTLGVISEATLNIIKNPEERLFFLIPFRHIKYATMFLSKSLKEHLSFSAIEFIDDTAKELVEKFLERKLPYSESAKCYLFLEHEGEINKNLLTEIVEETEGLDIFFAADKAQEERLWEARKKIAYAVKDFAKHVYKADIVVPRGLIPEFIEKAKKLTRKDLSIACFGHIGDGNIHLNILDVRGDKKEESMALMGNVMDLISRMGGFPSGEHGIGISKKEFLKTFFSGYHINIWREIKRVFDPFNIMNPGKIFD